MLCFVCASPILCGSDSSQRSDPAKIINAILQVVAIVLSVARKKKFNVLDLGRHPKDTRINMAKDK